MDMGSSISLVSDRKGGIGDGAVNVLQYIGFSVVIASVRL